AVTRPGVIIGSPAFMAPERASRGLATPASDMWSLGATLFAAVEGRSPYARPGALATLTALATQQPDPAPHAGPLAEVIDGLLRRDPASRMPATEVARRLRRIAATRIPHQVPVVPRPAIAAPLTRTRDQPKPDPVADWRTQEAYRVAHGDFPGYHRIRIAPVSYFVKAADWEFSYTRRGARTRVVNRGFITSAHQAYGLWWQVPDDAWAA